MAHPLTCGSATDPCGQKSDLPSRCPVTGDWPDFADEGVLPGAAFWLVLLGGALAAALGLGLVILAVLA